LQLDASRLPELRSHFEAVADERLAAVELGPSCQLDLPVRPEEIDPKLAEGLGRLAPFGAGNPEPVFGAFGLRGMAKLLPNKVSGLEGHLKVKLDGGLDAIGFGLGGSLALFQGKVDAAFHVGLDDWQGGRKVQLRLRSVRPAV
ncbi:MAG: single-stranded-DNA-specific exonuclease RecJ, partial [Deltaproteobacteria bacterium]